MIYSGMAYGLQWFRHVGRVSPESFGLSLAYLGGGKMNKYVAVVKSGVGMGRLGLLPPVLRSGFWSMGIVLAALAFVPATVQAQSWSLNPLSGFGVNGWLTGTAFGAGGTNSSIRSMAYNQATGNLLVANGSTVQIVNGTTGAIGASLNATGISGGARALNVVTVMTDGVIYGGNLTTSSASSPFKIYRWANESAVPTTFYNANGGEPGGARIGDSLASFGDDATGVLAFGTGTTAGVTTTYFSRLATNGGTAGTAVAMTGTGAANQSFRLGLVFADSDTVLGLSAGSTTNNALVSGTASPWTRDGLRTIVNSNERSVSSLANVFGTSLLATIQFGGSGTNTVRIYDATNIATANLGSPLASANIAGPAILNSNGTVGIAFGTVAGNPVLYAMNTNNGIQAFQIVPEPSTVAMLAVGGVGVAALGWRKRRMARRRIGG